VSHAELVEASVYFCSLPKLQKLFFLRDVSVQDFLRNLLFYAHVEQMQ
jgi:hypothetical protein